MSLLSGLMAGRWFGIAFLLFVGAAGAQESLASGRPAAELLSGVKEGAEGRVDCASFLPDAANSFLELGEQARSESLERATVAFRLAERAARCSGSEKELGAALNALGDSLFRRGALDAALAVARESTGIHEQLHDAGGQAGAWNIVANVRWTRGDMRGALADYQRTLDFWTAAGDHRGQGRAFNNIGNVYRSFGEFETALEFLSRALRTFEEIGDRRSAAVVTDNIAVLHFTRGDYSTALEYNRRALDIQRAAGNRDGIAKSLDSMGNIYRDLGAYGPALRCFQEALAIRIAVDDEPGVMETSHNIGLVHLSQGDYPLATGAFRRALQLNHKLHDQSLESEALQNLGMAAWRLGERQRAAADFLQSLAIARREGFRQQEGALLHDLGEMALAEGRIRQAEDLFDQAAAVRNAIGDYAGIVETLTGQAWTRLAAGRRQEALDLARQAVHNATAHDQPELLWEAQTALGVAQRRLGKSQEARLALMDAIGSIEQLSRQLIDSEALRQRFFENKLSPYHELIGLLAEQGAWAEAFTIAERSKARVLSRLLGTQRAGALAGLPASEEREWNRLRDAVTFRNHEIAGEQAKSPPDASRIKALESERRAAREELAAFETSAAARHPELGIDRGDLTPVHIDDAKPLLATSSGAIVEYVAADHRLFAFLLTRSGDSVTVEGRVIPIAEADLSERTRRFLDQIRLRDFDLAENARFLYSLLLGPFQTQLAGKTRLVVVPDGPLWDVPFQALMPTDGYLIERVALSYAPSAVVLRKILERPRPVGSPTVLAMARSDFRGAPERGLEPLPDADKQVRMIREIYGPERAATFTGSEATEGRFKSVARNYSILHLATHGIFDGASPLYSYLALSPAGDDAADDGRLEAWEIMRMKLNAELVVLAACETASGRIAPGEGVIGMSWALLAAGARSMVVSQFSVESRSATALLLEFHRRLAATGQSKSAALRAAALANLRTPRFAHPYYWAGFILLGDPD